MTKHLARCCLTARLAPASRRLPSCGTNSNIEATILEGKRIEWGRSRVERGFWMVQRRMAVRDLSCSCFPSFVTREDGHGMPCRYGKGSCANYLFAVTNAKAKPS